MYSIRVPVFILDGLEKLGMDPHRAMNHALAKGLRLLERRLEEPFKETWALYEYSEKYGTNEEYKKVRHHKTRMLRFEAGFKLMTRALLIIKICRSGEIDNRMLYYRALIEPYLPESADRRAIKEMLQSNQLEPKQPATIVSLCLWSHALRYDTIHKDQDRLDLSEPEAPTIPGDSAREAR